MTIERGEKQRSVGILYGSGGSNSKGKSREQKLPTEVRFGGGSAEVRRTKIPEKTGPRGKLKPRSKKFISKKLKILLDSGYPLC